MNKFLTSLVALWGVISINGHIDLGVENTYFVQVLGNSLQANKHTASSKSTEKKLARASERTLRQVGKKFCDRTVLFIKKTYIPFTVCHKYQGKKHIDPTLNYIKQKEGMTHGMGIRAPSIYIKYHPLINSLNA